MKVINISNLQTIPTTIEYIDCMKVRPILEVDNYHYYPERYGHFVYGLRGYANYTYKETLIEIYPNSLAYIPTGSDPVFSENSDYEFIKIYFKIVEQSTDEEIILYDVPKILFNETPTHIVHELNNMCTYYTSNNIAYLKLFSMFFSLLDNIYHALQRTDISPQNSSLPISPALLFIRNNYKYDYSTKELADICCLSESYFRKKFKEYTHSTPTEYRLFLQINDACQRLHDQQYSISYIAELAGFKSFQYFHKVFTKIMGISPSEYRKRLSHYNPGIK